MCLRFFTWCLVCFMIVPALAWAQHPNSKAEQALRNEMERQSRREAGQLKRAGWKVMPNKTSIEQQVRDVRFMEAATHDQSGERLYLISSSCASDSSYLKARRKADMSARDKMVQHVISLIYNNGAEDARSTGEQEMEQLLLLIYSMSFRFWSVIGWIGTDVMRCWLQYGQIMPEHVKLLTLFYIKKSDGKVRDDLPSFVEIYKSIL